MIDPYPHKPKSKGDELGNGCKKEENNRDAPIAPVQIRDVLSERAAIIRRRRGHESADATLISGPAPFAHSARLSCNRVCLVGICPKPSQQVAKVLGF